MRIPMRLVLGFADENILTPDEVRRVVAASEDHHRLLIQAAAFTGMRQGELLGLRWRDIDWSSRQIHVRRAWKDGAFTQPKTRNSQHRVDVPDFLLHEPKKWRLRCPKGELDMVFSNGAGNPETPANVLQCGFYPANPAKVRPAFAMAWTCSEPPTESWTRRSHIEPMATTMLEQ